MLGDQLLDRAANLILGELGRHILFEHRNHGLFLGDQFAPGGFLGVFERLAVRGDLFTHDVEQLLVGMDLPAGSFGPRCEIS